VRSFDRARQQRMNNLRVTTHHLDMSADRSLPPVVDTTAPPINAPQILSPADIVRGILDETRTYLSQEDAETMQDAFNSPQITQQTHPKPTLIDVLSALANKSSLLAYLSPESVRSLAATSSQVNGLVFGREAMLDEIHRVHKFAASHVGALYRESLSKPKLPPQTRHFMIAEYLNLAKADGRMFRVLWGLWNLIFPIFNSNGKSQAGQPAQVEWLREFLEHESLPEMMATWIMSETHTYRWLLRWIAQRHGQCDEGTYRADLLVRVHSILVDNFGQTEPPVHLEGHVAE